MLNKTFSFNSDPSNTFQRRTVERVTEVNNLIDFVRKHSPISIWDLGKETGISHSKLYYLLRDLEFSGVIYSKILTNEKNRVVRMIYINREARA